MFELLPEVDDFGLWLVCEGEQYLQGELVFTNSSKQQLQVSFPPQPLQTTTVSKTAVLEAAEEGGLEVNLNIAAFPLPTGDQVVWDVYDENDTVVQEVGNGYSINFVMHDKYLGDHRPNVS